MTRKEAKAAGDKTFIGVPCKNGHEGLRYTSTGSCVACLAARNATPEVRAQQQRYVQANKILISAKRKAYAASHMEERREAARRWRAKNPGKLKAYVRGYKQHGLPGYGKDIAAIYATARSGEEVDHIVPFKHPLVCGLHVPWNLQVLPEWENRSKGNRFDPDDPLQGSLAPRWVRA